MDQTTAYIPHASIVKIMPADKMRAEIETRVGVFVTDVPFTVDANGISGTFVRKPKPIQGEERFY